MNLRPHLLVTLLIISLMVSACQAATSETTTITPGKTISSTILPVSKTPTQASPPGFPTSSPSPEPTATEELIAAHTDCPLQPSRLSDMNLTGAPISAGNAEQVVCLGRWGVGIIYEVDYSPDGERLAVKSSLGITLYEAESLQEITFLEIPIDDRLGPMLYPGMTNLMSFSVDGQILAVAVGEKVVLYQASDGSSLGELVGQGENYLLMTIDFSPDGKLLAASEGWSQDVNVWQVGDRKLLYSWQEEVPSGLIFSPDGQLLVSSNGQVRDMSDGSLLSKIEVGGCCLNQVTFSPDGKYITAVWDQDGILKMWRTNDGKVQHTFDGYGKSYFSSDSSKIKVVMQAGVVQIISTSNGELISSDTYENSVFVADTVFSFSQDGTRLVTGNYNGIVNVWNLSNGQLIYALSGHLGIVGTAQYSPDGEIIVTADVARVRTWRTADGSLLESRQHAFPAVVLSPEGKTLVTELKMYWNGIQIWNASDGSPRYTLEDTRWPLAFSNDGEMLATSQRKISTSGYISDTIQLNRVSDGESLYQLDADVDEYDNPTFELVFSQDGSYIAAVHDPGDIWVWKVSETKLLYRLSGADYSPFVKIAISPDGGYLATGNGYHTVQIWGIETGELLQTLEMEPTEIMGTSGAVSSLVFSPDGRLLAALDEGGFYQIWQVSDWTTLQHDSDFVNQYDLWRSAVGMAFSPDGNLLATAGTGDAISLWDVADGSLLITLTGHVDDIVRVSFSPDGRWFYSTSMDGTVRFWGLPGE